MKKICSMMVILGLAAAVALVAAGCKKESPQPAPKTEAAAPAAAPIAQKVCPVTGDPINPNIYVDYQGRRIYFCCPMCPPIFKKDPEKYLKKVDEQLKAGAAEAKPATEAMPGTTAAPAEPGKAAYWTCSMHPEVRADKPGNCPKCGMALQPVAEGTPKP